MVQKLAIFGMGLFAGIFNYVLPVVKKNLVNLSKVLINLSKVLINLSNILVNLSNILAGVDIPQICTFYAPSGIFVGVIFAPSVTCIFCGPFFYKKNVEN